MITTVLGVSLDTIPLYIVRPTTKGGGAGWSDVVSNTILFTGRFFSSIPDRIFHTGVLEKNRCGNALQPAA